MPICPKCKHEVVADAKYCGNCAAPMPQTTNLVGKCINNKYIVTKRIAEGGMGEVYLARQQGIDQEVAIKKLHRDLCKNQKLVDRFITEAKAYGKISHPNAVKVHDLLNVNGELCIVMEYVRGKTLTSYIEAKYAFSQNQIIHIALQVADALATAHAAAIIHRDLKTENIMLLESVSGRFSAKILDFGIAKVADAPTDGQTCQGTILGTPEFMSPEQCCGKDIDGRSDIYAFGIILYMMLSGHLPFTAESKVGIIGQQLNCFPPKLRGLNGEAISEEIECVTMKCLRKDPKDRYQQFADVIQDLERIREGSQPVFASPQDIIVAPEDPLEMLQHVSQSHKRALAKSNGEADDAPSEENVQIELGDGVPTDDEADVEQLSHVELGVIPKPSVFAPALDQDQADGALSEQAPKITLEAKTPEQSDGHALPQKDDVPPPAQDSSSQDALRLPDTPSSASLPDLTLGDADIDEAEEESDEESHTGGIGKIMRILFILLVVGAVGYVFAAPRLNLPGHAQITEFLHTYGVSEQPLPSPVPEQADTALENVPVPDMAAPAVPEFDPTPDTTPTVRELPDAPPSEIASRNNIMRGLWRTSLDHARDTLYDGKLEDASEQLNHIQQHHVGFSETDIARLTGHQNTYQSFKSIYDAAIRDQKNYECSAIKKNVDKIPEDAKGFRAQIDKLYRKCNASAEAAPTTL